MSEDSIDPTLNLNPLKHKKNILKLLFDERVRQRKGPKFGVVCSGDIYMKYFCLYRNTIF